MHLGGDTLSTFLLSEFDLSASRCLHRCICDSLSLCTQDDLRGTVALPMGAVVHEKRKTPAQHRTESLVRCHAQVRIFNTLDAQNGTARWSTTASTANCRRTRSRRSWRE